MRLPVVLALALVGCVQHVVVAGPVVQPARVPVRAFPQIWLVPGALAHEQRVAKQLAAHLRKARTSRVAILDQAAVERRRDRGRIPPGTVVVALEIDFDERVHLQWGRRPETVCDSVGCYMTRRTRPRDTPVLKATLRLDVGDPLTGQRFQRAHVRAVEYGARFEAMRTFVVSELVERAKLLTEQRVRYVTVELRDTGAVPMEEVIALAEQERFREAAAALERGLRARTGLPAAEQARALRNLSQLYRLSGGGTLPGALLQAERALARAQALDPDRDYPSQRRLLQKQRTQALLVRQQRVDAVHNFRAARPLADRRP